MANGKLAKFSAPKNSNPNLHILIIRAHAGEISFPGGRCESGETVVETAIRETTEELGIKSDKIDVWDKLRPVTDKKGIQNL